MKEGKPPWHHDETVGVLVAEYSAEHSLGLPKPLLDYHAHVLATEPLALKMVPASQGQAMVWLAHVLEAKKVLEIGVYHGFSCMVWSHAVGAQGQVTGLEFDPEYAARSRAVFAEHGMDNIRVVTGDALKTLAQQVPTAASDSTTDADDDIENQPYDIIFIDAQKSDYPAYLRTILENSPPASSADKDDDCSSSRKKKRLLRKGGLIIGDNALRFGAVVDESEENNPFAYNFRQKYYGENEAGWNNELVKLREFNREMKENPRLEAWLCPLWDGVIMARLKD
ncbi:S-adenosyl-L-methionine-dependent methyltransferase [Apiospora arundinis]|uniref:S-adenosyl-L-methionine-dependent methyltransferase n=1 Tax=Apiospora arundinis TaxID=335852 RepID=A0ABR2JIH1_9PEZI